MDKDEFYAILDSEEQMNDTLRNVLIGPNRDNSSFFELCRTFAEAAENHESAANEIEVSLRKAVSDFCQHNCLCLNQDLRDVLQKYYRILLPIPSPQFVKEDNSIDAGGQIGWFIYHPGLPIEIWVAIFGESASFNEGGKKNV